MQAIDKSRLINYLTPKKKKIKIMNAETLFRINLFYLPNLTPKSGITFYREGWVYYYNLSTGPMDFWSWLVVRPLQVGELPSEINGNL